MSVLICLNDHNNYIVFGVWIWITVGFECVWFLFLFIHGELTIRARRSILVSWQLSDIWENGLMWEPGNMLLESPCSAGINWHQLFWHYLGASRITHSNPWSLQSYFSWISGDYLMPKIESRLAACLLAHWGYNSAKEHKNAWVLLSNEYSGCSKDAGGLLDHSLCYVESSCAPLPWCYGTIWYQEWNSNQYILSHNWWWLFKNNSRGMTTLIIWYQ